MSDSAVSESKNLDQLCINAIRILSMDAVQAANSGHPGAPMGLAPLAWLLFSRHMKHNPADPEWINRDRLVLSGGHGSMLLYSALHLSGYEVTLEDIQQFRQWGSKTPGHPEYGHTPGVETTTGPLGQGVANAVGMAIAEANLGATFNHTGHYVIDHQTWFICGDGDLQEGISHEACALAGHLKLGKLIGFYDSNQITIEGERELSDSEDTRKRFESYGWHVVDVEDINDLDLLDDAIDACKAEFGRPSLVIMKSHIAYGSPNKQDTAAAHGSPLGAEEVALTRKQLGWECEDAFYVPMEVRDTWARCKEHGHEYQDSWKKTFKKYKASFPAESEELKRRLKGRLPKGWEESLPDLGVDAGDMASRAASGKVLNALAEAVPALIGGSADLAPSNNTEMKELPWFASDRMQGRNIHFGIREHAMGAIQNGLALHGGFVPYAGTFLVFSDYMRTPIRLSSLMGLRTIYVFTHDSIGLGEDGPTHQPIEHLTSLRAIPGLHVIRPADAAETVEAWRHAIRRADGPTALVLSRQTLHGIHRPAGHEAGELAQGAYTIHDPQGGEPDLVLLASGSEVELCIDAARQLEKDGHAVRVVSFPCQELFLRQDADYQESVLPAACTRRLAVEAAEPMSWWRFVGSGGDVLGIDKFGASAPAEVLFEKYGFTVENVVERAKRLLG